MCTSRLFCLLLENNVCTPTLLGSKAAAQRPFDRGPPMRPKWQCSHCKGCQSKLCRLQASRFGTGRSLQKRNRLSYVFYASDCCKSKRVSQDQLPSALRCWPSNSAVSRLILLSDRIPFDSRPRIARANRENQKKSPSWELRLEKAAKVVPRGSLAVSYTHLTLPTKA